MPPDIDVTLACPRCGHTWLAAIIRPGAWWAEGATPAKTAKRCYCPTCEAPPPMTVVQAMTKKMKHLTAGIPGDELIRRRAASLCVACGFTEVFPLSSSSEQPWLCQDCRKKVPPKPRFDRKQHRKDGIKNLERLDS